ncbi:histone H1-delta-like [Montipora capricornis]|uniref:histone H1-delta-like n=1 Tax=Montipora capricornis TaxID=246305 RepID=UPI0035F202BB
MSVAKAKPVTSHPKYIDMVVSAVKALAEKNGSSRQAINKHIVKEYKLTDNKHHSAMLKQALQRGSGPNGPLVHNKGKGAAGSFKIKPAPAKPVKPVNKKAPMKKRTPKKGASKPAKPDAVVLSMKTPLAGPVPTPKKPAKPVKGKVAKERSAKTSKAASPKKPKVVKPKKSSKKPVHKK